MEFTQRYVADGHFWSIIVKHYEINPSGKRVYAGMLSTRSNSKIQKNRIRAFKRKYNKQRKMTRRIYESRYSWVQGHPTYSAWEYQNLKNIMKF